MSKSLAARSLPLPRRGRVPEGRVRALQTPSCLSNNSLMKVTSPRLLARARALRKKQTAAETRLWGRLRNRSLQGHKFNRQKPIGCYIPDFVCFERKLIVEVDGATHGNQHELLYDSRREVFLKQQGYRVHRCNNEDVFKNIGGVLDSILLKLNSSSQMM